MALALYDFGWVVMYDQPETALAAFEESLELSKAGATDTAYAHSLCRSAALRAQRGDRHALVQLRDAIAFSHEIRSLITTMAVLDYGTRVLAALGASALGASVAGFLESGGRTVPWTVAGPDAGARTKALQQLKDDLDPEQFERHYAHGAQLDYDSLIQALLQGLDAIINADRREFENNDGART